MAFFQVFTVSTVAHGTLMYIAQAFMLAGSIFGLDYYVQKIKYYADKQKQDAPEGHKE